MMHLLADCGNTQKIFAVGNAAELKCALLVGNVGFHQGGIFGLINGNCGETDSFILLVFDESAYCECLREASKGKSMK